MFKLNKNFTSSDSAALAQSTVVEQKDNDDKPVVLAEVLDCPSPPAEGQVDGTSVGDVMTAVDAYEDFQGDQIDGTDGEDDLIYGHCGDDLIYTGYGSDTAFGGLGHDIIHVNHTGKMAVSAADLEDIAHGDTGNDTLIAHDDGNQAKLHGDEGDDDLYDGARMFGGTGDDEFWHQMAGRTSFGDGDDDTFYITNGDSQTAHGGQGADKFFVDAAEIDELYISGGAGDDEITINSSNSDGQGENWGKIESGSGDDTIILNGFEGRLKSGGNNDTILVDEYSGNIDAGSGDDFIETSGVAGGIQNGKHIYMTGGDGSDIIVAGSTWVFAFGGEDDSKDIFYNKADSDVVKTFFFGGHGNDEFYLDQGASGAEGGWGNDKMVITDLDDFDGESHSYFRADEDAWGEEAKDDIADGDWDFLDVSALEDQIFEVIFTSDDNEDGSIVFNDGTIFDFSDVEQLKLSKGIGIGKPAGEDGIEDTTPIDGWTGGGDGPGDGGVGGIIVPGDKGDVHGVSSSGGDNQSYLEFLMLNGKPMPEDAALADMDLAETVQQAWHEMML